MQRPPMQSSAPVAGVQSGSSGVARIVFIAGSSFSGSTLISLMLGSQPNIVFAGELKDYRRRMQSEVRGLGAFCSCGKSRQACPLWSAVQERYGSEADLNPAPGFSWRNVALAIKLLAGIGLRRQVVTAHGSLVKAVYEEVHSQHPDVEYVVDSSKSISSLDAISRMPGVEVSVIHLIRNGTAVAGSYKKRGSAGLYGMATWSIGNVFMRLYVRRRKLRSIRVDYRSLCIGDESTYRAINAFLGTRLNLGNAVDDIKRTQFHIVSGNGGVRRSASDFQGIRYSESPFNANRLERWVANAVVQPLNRRFGVTQGAEPQS